MKISIKILLLATVFGMAMSGGIHRVAQSTWNCPQAGLALKLRLYFSLDSGVAATGKLLVTLPAGAAHTTTATTHKLWALTTTLEPPTTGATMVACTAPVNNVVTCTTGALSANTAYGLELVGTGAVAGAWAPVAL